MKRILILLFSTAVLASCMPQAYPLLYNVSYPGAAGFVLDNKTMSVVYLDDGIPRDSAFVNALADGFTKGLEKEYFQSEESVPMFSIDKDPAGKYHSKDTLVNLLMATGADVMFLFDGPAATLGQNSDYTPSYVYVYDAMDQKRDSVVAIALNHSIPESLDGLPGVRDYGTRISSLFENNYRQETFSLIYYDDIYDWTRALFSIEVDDDWNSAMDIWIGIINNCKDIQKQACACYNMAVACFLMGDYALARSWGEMSAKFYPVSLQPGIMQRISEME